MSPYKAFLNNTRQYFNTNGLLRFLLSMYIVVFAIGGVFFAIGAFVYTNAFVSQFFGTLGIIFMIAGLQLTMIKEDEMTLAIASTSISFIGLLSWILALAGAGTNGHGIFYFSPFFFFLAFGVIATLVFLKGEKFVQMRAASAARMAGVPCPRCGSFISANAAFCPSCGAQNPATQQYTPPAQPQYAPPAPPAEAEAQASAQCASCGADIPEGSAFCLNCGAKQ